MPEAEADTFPQYQQNYALYNAPPGTWQRMSMFFYAAPEPGEATRQAALACWALALAFLMQRLREREVDDRVEVSDAEIDQFLAEARSGGPEPAPHGMRGLATKLKAWIPAFAGMTSRVRHYLRILA